METDNERGNALIVVLMAMSLLLGLGGGLAMLTSTESALAAHFGHGLEAFYAAEAAVERAMADLHVAQDWSAVLDGRVMSTFMDGVPSGVRTLAGGALLDLAAVTNLELCGRPAGCPDEDLDAVTAERRHGPNNPRWRLYAYGPIRDLLPSNRIRSQVFVVVWVGDDPLETDGAPLADGEVGVSPGHGVVMLRARAYGVQGARRGVEAMVARGTRGLRILSWREL